jgi:heme oxygenase
MTLPPTHRQIPSPILDALRGATRDLHARLDAELGLTGPSLSRARYVSFLRGTAAVMIPLERALGVLPAWPEALPDAASRRRAHLLALDLRALDAGDAQEGPPLRVADLAEAFGCAYVSEGSTLGAVVLARAIEPALGLSPERGTAYLRAYGDAVGPRWRAFVGHLEAFAAGLDDAGRGALVGSAVATFGAFADAFRRAGGDA